MMMVKLESLGIKRIEALHYYVHDLDRSHTFYTEKLDFAHIAKSTPELEAKGHQRSAAYAAGNCLVICSAPVGEGGRAWRYLRKHPDGIGTLVFEVEDIEKAFKLLDERGGTFINDIERAKDDHGTLAFFSITTPFGDTTFRFVERRGYRSLYPGMVNLPVSLDAHNKFEFQEFDHITANFQTMKPALLWMEHVLGFESYWKIDFHTDDVAKRGDHGSGLRSMVMHDPHSPVKFANNEPYRPFFKQSQINIFTEEHRGDGIQHAAITVKDIIGSVRGMRKAGVQFMPTPGTYYDTMPARLKQMKVGHIDEDIEVLRDLEILVDGAKEHAYMLQIFMKEAAGTYNEPEAGPFFYEIIQRKGDNLFGAGNFRALFESIERAQKKEGRA
jgi:4-hydroxyphenylpyruvate dioxygenase